MTDPRDPAAHAGLPFPPPLVPAAGLLLGWALNRLLDLPPGPHHVWLGGAVACAGLALAAWAAATLWRRRTAVLPHHPTTALVAAGPFGFSRNPIYLGMALVVLGAALAAGGAFWLSALLVPLVLDRAIIAREEAYLAARFQTAYEDYCARVRRWF